MSPPIQLGAADPSRVNVKTPHELRWWCRQLGATPDEPRAIVAKVGARTCKRFGAR